MPDKQKLSAILSVVLTAIVALLAVFGYHVVIVQPEITALEAGFPARLDSAAFGGGGAGAAIESVTPACPTAPPERR